MTNQTGNEAQALLNQIVFDYLREKRRNKFWRLIKNLLILMILGWFIYVLFFQHSDDALKKMKPHVGYIDLIGEIGEQKITSADNLAKGLQKAYSNQYVKAVVLRINSPGGSPVQADYMFNILKYYRNKYSNIKLYAVCEDLCASAAYYVASAADEIYANPSSLVGSIGVIYSGFGFVDTLQKVGVARRVQTAGKYKDFMDPYKPVSPQETEHLQVMLNRIHEQFIAQVKKGRGDRLMIDENTFSGLFWDGKEAKKRGLIDGFASAGQLARDVIKIEQMIDYTYKQNMIEQMAGNVGTSMAEHLPEALGLKPQLR